MSLPILYSFRRCPYAIRARLALKAAKVNVELREVVLRAKPEAMLAASPKGTVPVLLLPSGKVLDESLDIMIWALRQNDPEGWLANGDWPVQLALIAINDGAFKLLLDRYKYPNRFPEKSAITYRDEAVELHIAPLNKRLSEAPYLFGSRPSLADMAILPFVRQFSQVDAAWFGSAFPLLKHWVDKQTAEVLFESAMARLPLWQPGDAMTVF